jgi:hypothetical protein
MFGQKQNASSSAQPFSGLFGATTTAAQSQPPTSTPSLFGSSAPPTTQPQLSTGFNFFGSQNTTPQPSTSFSFGQQTSSAPSFTFGQSAITAASSTTSDQSAAPTFSFGQPANVSTATPTEQTVAPKFAFGQSPNKSTQSTSEQPSTPKFTFGQSANSASTITPTAEQSTPKFSFGQSTSAPTPTAPASERPAPSFTFGQQTSAPSPPKPAAEQSTPPFNFGQQASNPSASSAEQSAPKFSFGQQSSTPSVPADSATPKFSFGQQSSATPAASSPSKFSFGQQASAPESAPAAPSPPQFSFGGQSTISAAPAASPTPKFNFGPQASAPSPAAAEPSPPKITFGQRTPVTSQAPLENSPSKFGFGQSTTTPSAASPEKSSSKFSFGQQAPALPSAAATPAKTLQPDVSNKPSSNVFSAKRTPATETPSGQQSASSILFLEKGVPQAVSATASTERPVYTKSPSHTPKFLNAEGFMEYDKNYRLHALNKEFKKKIATINTDRHDLDNIVRHYVAARAAIGGDMGLYQRTTAGSKRKTTDIEEENVPPQYKKARFSADPVSEPKSTTATAPVTANTAVPSNSNPFAGIFPPPTSSNTSDSTNSVGPNTLNAGATPAAKKYSSFTPPQPSTTPVKSPPKKSLFGMSSIESSANNKPSGEDGPLKQRSTPINGFTFTKEKRKAVEEGEISSEDEAVKKRTKGFTETNANLFGGTTPKASATTNTWASMAKKSGPFISDDEETDNASGDLEDGDFAPNADGSDDDSADGESREPSDEEYVQTAQEDSETSGVADEDHTEEIKNNPNAGRSLFDRIQPPASKQLSTSAASDTQTNNSTINWPKAGNSPFGQTPDSSAFSPTPVPATSPYKPATTFTFTPTPSSRPASSAGASVLAGGSTNGQESRYAGMFGSPRSGTPEPDTSAPKAAPTSTPASDNTWKKSQDIKFNLTEATPEKAARASFGTNSLGFSFGNSSTPAPGFLSATPYLGVDSGLSSGISSRATSPGATDNESVATNDTNDEDTQTDVQQDLMSANPGEENDEIIWNGRGKALLLANGERAKALKVIAGKWTSIGVGSLKLLKSNETGRVRVLLRSDPGANVVLNSYLEPEIDYIYREPTEGQKNGAVTGAFVRDGHLDGIVLKVKGEPETKQLAELMNKHRHDRK